jgi:hypothetical protein
MSSRAILARLRRLRADLDRPDTIEAARCNLRDLGAALAVVAALLDGTTPPAVDGDTLARLRVRAAQVPPGTLLGDLGVYAARDVVGGAA